MAELPIISVKRRDVEAINKRVRRGDPTAQADVQHLFDDYPRPLECFIDGREIAGHPAIMFLPERGTNEDMMAVPLCLECNALPPMLRWGRAIKILKRMWPGTHFHFR